MINQEQDGDGVIDWLKSKFSSGANRLLPMREAGKNPPDVRKFLELHGNEQITSLKAKRVPVESAVQSVLNVVSFGALKKAVKELGYDNIFHLSIVINDKYELDKREVITVRKYERKANEELVNIPLNNKRLTISQFLENGRIFMGNEKYSEYNPENNNCQDFIMGLLQGNNLGNNDSKTFIKQDALKIFEKLPSFAQKFAKFVAGSIAGRANRLLFGEGQIAETPRQKLLEKIENEMGRSMRVEKQKRVNDIVKRIAMEM